MPQDKTINEGLTQNSPLAFRWTYVALPVLLALACIILAAVLYSRLPAELGLRFQSDGTPLNLLSKGAFVALMLTIQVVLTLTAGGIAFIFLKFGRMMARNSVLPGYISSYILLMSNMLLLPQVIIGYLMLDSFIYGLNSTHWILFTTFALWTVGVGTIILFVMFGRVFTQLRTGAIKK